MSVTFADWADTPARDTSDALSNRSVTAADWLDTERAMFMYQKLMWMRHVFAVRVVSSSIRRATWRRNDKVDGENTD